MLMNDLTNYDKNISHIIYQLCIFTVLDLVFEGPGWR